VINNAFQEQYEAVPARVVRPVYTTVTIAAFTLSSPSEETSGIAGTAALGNTENFSIALPFQQNVDNPDTSYVICVRYTDANGITYRYLLFDGNDAFSTTFAEYTGQTIGPNAVIEIWANPANLTVMASDDIVFYINTLTRYGNQNSSFCACYYISPNDVTLIPSL